MVDASKDKLHLVISREFNNNNNHRIMMTSPSDANRYSINNLYENGIPPNMMKGEPSLGFPDGTNHRSQFWGQSNQNVYVQPPTRGNLGPTVIQQQPPPHVAPQQQQVVPPQQPQQPPQQPPPAPVVEDAACSGGNNDPLDVPSSSGAAVNSSSNLNTSQAANTTSAANSTSRSHRQVRFRQETAIWHVSLMFINRVLLPLPPVNVPLDVSPSHHYFAPPHHHRMIMTWWLDPHAW